ncbi:MAG: hypothetical protein ABSC51_01120 [Gaiellaceae bacterium]|jgi:hypothetical protein
MNKFVELDFPLRGCITFGDVIRQDDLLVGAPVIRAVRGEAMIEAPFVVLPARETVGCLLKPNRDYGITVSGNGLMAGYIVTPAPIYPLHDLARRKLEKYALEGPHSIASVWRSALSFIENEL